MHSFTRLPSSAELGRTRPDPPFWSKTTWIQLGYAMWANQVVIVIGLTFGFSAVTVPQLQKPDAIFKSTLSDQAWIASVVVLVAPIGCLVSGFLMDRIGRRWMLVLCLLPMVGGWVVIGFADSANKLIMGRVITGIGLGLCAGPPRTYSTEISLPNVRGVTGVIPTFSVSLGMLSQGVLGKVLRWQTISYVCASYAGLVMTMNVFLPETPYFILIGGTKDNMRKSLRRLRAKNYDIEYELESMIRFKLNNRIRTLPWRQNLKNLFKPYSLKPFTITFIYMIVGQLSGISIMMFWTVDILKDSRLSIDPYIGNIVVTGTRALGGFGSTVLVFLCSRRLLSIGSAISIGIICLSMGLFLYFVSTPTIVPLIAYMIYILCALSGYYSLPIMMLYELIPLQIRGTLGGISVSVLFLLMFCANASYPYIRSVLSMSTTLILFGIFSLLGSLYLFYFLPETKDLTLQQIEEFYRGSLSRISIHREQIDKAAARYSAQVRHKLSTQIKNSEEQEDDKIQELGMKRRKSSVGFYIKEKAPDVDEPLGIRDENEEPIKMQQTEQKDTSNKQDIERQETDKKEDRDETSKGEDVSKTQEEQEINKKQRDKTDKKPDERDNLDNQK